jgi:hypothetical protein
MKSGGDAGEAIEAPVEPALEAAPAEPALEAAPAEAEAPVEAAATDDTAASA